MRCAISSGYKDVNMYCKNCGKKIPDGSGFCQHCGTNQNAVSNANRQIVGSNKSRSGIFQKKIIFGNALFHKMVKLVLNV